MAFLLTDFDSETARAIIKEEPSLLIVNSGGGSIDAALSILSWLEQSETKVIIAGQCSSATCYLLALDSSRVTIMPHTYGIQHAPEILRDVKNHMPGIDSCWLKAAHTQWEQDRPIYEEVIGRTLDGPGDVCYLDYHALRLLLTNGKLRAAYVAN